MDGAAMDPSVIFEASSAAAQRITSWAAWEFRWERIEKGDCTMVDGAVWTLFPNGTATFDATVTSSVDDDAWVIWHVDLLDRDDVVLGSLASALPIDGDWRKFVQTMAHNTERYRFRALATFDTALWNDLAKLKLYSSC